MKPRILLVSLGALLAAAACVAALGLGRGMTKARPQGNGATGPADANGRPDETTVPKAGPVEFVPTAEGVHTAWLVAGPFEKPQPEPEKIATPQEGKALSGRLWQLLPWPNTAVDLGEGGGIRYAAGSLVSAEGGERELRIRSRGAVRVWLNGQPAGGSERDAYWGLHNATLTVRLRKGANPLLLECASGLDGRAGFVLSLVEVSKGAELFAAQSAPAPERLALQLRDADPLRLHALLARAIAVSPVDVWLAPDQPPAISLSRTGSAPALNADLELRLTARPNGATETDRKPLVRQVAAADLLAGAGPVALPAPETACLALECAVEIAAPNGGRALSRSSCLFYSKAGLEEESRRLLARSLLTSAADRTAADAGALAHLKGEKALLMLSSPAPGETGARAALDELSAGREALEAAAGKRDPLAGRVGWLERAYRSEADGSAQPYRLYVPKRLADPAERQDREPRIPMIVYLHGWVPDYDKHSWVEEDSMRDFCAIAERFGAILLVPFGRSNTDFASIGEVDVLRAIDETCRLYPVNRDRVSICGYSMGGYGAYLVAAHHPDRFSALAVLSGRPVPYYLEQQGRAGKPRYKLFCLDVDNPLALAPSLLDVPVRIFHNRAEFIPFASALAMRDRLKKAGAAVGLQELGGDHWSGFGALASPETVGWMVAQRRQGRPARLAITTFSPRWGSAYWARIDRIDRWTEAAELDVDDDGRGAVRISARNVREFSLADVPLKTRIEGADAFHVEFLPQAGKETCAVRARLKTAPRPGRWAKSAALPGPMREACNGPFVVAWGSAGSADETADNEMKARRFAAEWRRFAKGEPQTVDEKTLSDDEKTARSMVVFGTPATSALVAEAAKLGALECRIAPDTFEVAGKRIGLTAGRGLVLTRPSPWANRGDRYLVVCAGAFYGENLSENHKLDLIPDFIVFGPGKEGEGEPPAILAGFFDSDWKADPSLVEVFEKP